LVPAECPANIEDVKFSTQTHAAYSNPGAKYAGRLKWRREAGKAMVAGV